MNVLSSLLKFIGEGGLWSLTYPVGSYYETSDSNFDPNVTWGGTWVKENAGYVHVSSGTGYSVSGATGDSGRGTKDGGSKDAVVVSHNHTQNAHSHYSQWGSFLASNVDITLNGTKRHLPDQGGDCYMVYSSANGTINEYGTTAATVATNNSAGVSGTDKNMQPYIVVNRWHRTA